MKGNLNNEILYAKMARFMSGFNRTIHDVLQ